MKGEVTELMAFLEKSPTSAHCVTRAELLLKKDGFEKLTMDEQWDLKPGDRRYVIDSESTLAAFSVGERPPSQSGFRTVGTHTDAPGFRLKPEPYSFTEGVSTLGVEIYGGPTIATWVDRDLGLAGAVTFMGENGLETRLYNISRPVLRFPSPAIHLNRTANEKGFKVNAEDQLLLVFGDKEDDDWEALRQLIADSAGIEKDAMLDFSGEVYDLQSPALGGIGENYLISPRIDNLASTHAAVMAMIKADRSDCTAVALLFDNEEIGSRTVNGAASPFMERILERLAGGREEYFRACALSMNVSADCVHAVHPGWAGKHSKLSKPHLNSGPAIKMSAGGSYASSSRTAAYFARCAELADSPVQKFVSRADGRSGGTLGPIAAAGTGIPTVDVGNPMLSMHSAREMAGTVDHANMINCMRVHLEGLVPLAQ